MQAKIGERQGEGETEQGEGGKEGSSGLGGGKEGSKHCHQILPPVLCLKALQGATSDPQMLQVQVDPYNCCWASTWDKRSPIASALMGYIRGCFSTAVSPCAQSH